MNIPKPLIGLVFTALIFLTAFLISWSVAEAFKPKKEA